MIDRSSLSPGQSLGHTLRVHRLLIFWIAQMADATSEAPTAQQQRASLDRMINRSVVGLIAAMVLVVATYAVIIAPNSQGLSFSPEAWGQFGDYFGGILNPLIACGAFFWLTRSVALQKQELEDTRVELRESKEAQQQLAARQLVTAELIALSAVLTSFDQQLSDLAHEKREVEGKLEDVTLGAYYGSDPRIREAAERIGAGYAKAEENREAIRARIVAVVESMNGPIGVSVSGTPQADAEG